MLKGVRCEEMVKKIPAKSTDDTYNRFEPNPCSGHH
nr:MAG TPA: hypothetical protein [Caudoviricetes sp.]